MFSQIRSSRGFANTPCCLCFWTRALHFHPFSICSPQAPMELTQGCRSRSSLHHLCCAGWKCCSSPRGAGLSLCLLSGHFIRAGLLAEAKWAGSSFPGRDILHPRTACLSHPLAQQESRASLLWLKHQNCDGNIK